MDQVEEIKQRTDIVSVISERIEVKKAGKNYKALCPFHQEKTPSFMISPELQIYKCFGCGESGDVFSFLEKYEGMTFFESLQYLADKLGIKLKRVNLRQQDKRDRILLLNDLTSKFYNFVLLEHKIGKKALSYLTEKRGLKIETIRKFNLGFSPKNSQALVKFLIKKKGFTKEELVESGIFFQRSGFLQDRFAGRVVFPLYDHRGNIVGFGGRILPVEFGGEENQDQAKYINSPETLVYKKSRVLFGLNLVKEEIKREKKSIIVEGELDMISSYQAQIKNVVAVKGSALTEEQVNLLLRFTDEFVFAYDTDSAGVNAIRRGSLVAQKAGASIRVARLLGYKDPDEMARSNPEGLRKAISEAVPVWDFLIDLVFESCNLKTGEGKAKISKELMPILSSIEDKIVQAHYIELVAERLGVPSQAVFEEVTRKQVGVELSEKSLLEKTSSKRSRRDLLEEELLAFIFQLRLNVFSSLDIDSLVKTRSHKKLLSELKGFLNRRDEFDPYSFLKSLPVELSDRFSRLMLYDLNLSSESEDELDKRFSTIKLELEIESLKEDRFEIQKKMERAEIEKDLKLLGSLKRDFAKKTELLSILNKKKAVV